MKKHGTIPAEQIVWPVTYELLTIARRQRGPGGQMTPILLDNGDPAIAWEATFAVYNTDGKLSRLPRVTVHGKSKSTTAVSRIEARALKECYEILGKAGVK
jgi:hypothetical protein